MSKDVDPKARLRALVGEHGTQTAAAKVLGVSLAYLNDMLFGRRDVSERILAKLGLRRAVVERAPHYRATPRTTKARAV